jgi:hypothetical protein
MLDFFLSNPVGNTLGVVLLVLLFFLGVFFLRRLLGAERIAQLAAAWNFLDDFIWDAIIFIEKNPEIQSQYTLRAVQEGIDARMLYVLDELQALIRSRPELQPLHSVDLAILYRRAEGIYTAMLRTGDIVSTSGTDPDPTSLTG